MADVTQELLLKVKKKAVIPENYGLDSKGLWFLSRKYDKRTDSIVLSRVYMTFGPVWLSSNAKCLDTKNGHLVIRYIDDDIVREQIIERKLLYSGSLGGALGGRFDFRLWPEHVSTFSRYLLIADNSCEQTEKYREVTGWIKTDDGQKFALYGDNGVLVKPKDGGLVQKYNACHARGEKSVFLDAVFKALVKNPLACIPFAGSVATPMLSRLGAASMTIDIHGGSTNGKTTVAQMSMATFGDAKLLETRWASPPGGIEAGLDFFSDLPFYLDEAHAVRDKKLIFETIYNNGNSVGRLRGNSQGGAQKARRRSCMLLSTSEKGLMKLVPEQLDGIDARIIPVKGDPFGNYTREEVVSLEVVFRQNYGWVGKDLIYHLENVADFEEIQNSYRQYETDLMVHVKSDDRIQGRKVGTYAVFLCGIDVLQVLYPNYKQYLDTLRQHLIDYWKTLCESRDGSSKSRNSYQALLNFYSKNKHRFGDKKAALGALYSGQAGTEPNPGKVDRIGFYEDTWNKVLKAKGFDGSIVLEDFMNRDWVLYTESPKRKTKNVRIRTKVNDEEARLIVLSLKGRAEYESGSGAE